ncbi:FAD-binding oxidoreductase [Alkalicaulis satelles]|uniref:FAD-binding oxidoreductase n=1 Tax=Alkalicaulis satelles TaxID=2609175 RepID=A0A5M6ZI64_9PROT|nr:FAD-binding oxidoreductase [Alkalicaulis satelles]KAA5804522.1 FAD-binding oxidoreductase [Alkalicaulis satelles]
MTTDALTALTSALPPASWSRDADEIAPHARDWRGRVQGDTPLLLKPGNTQEVSRILGICHDRRIAVLPQGGNTGLVGGSTPKGEVLISLKRMNAIRAVDPANDSLTCEAGAILETVQTAAREAGRLFPLSLGAQGSAMIGGLISTNAGGVHVLRYGMMRELVLGLEAVLPGGRVVSDLAGLRKDNTGYDLKQLFIGAEGTLGVVTGATLKLFARPASTAVAVAAVADPAAAVELLSLMKEQTGGVCAFELMPRIGLDLVVAHVPGSRHPLGREADWCVLIEVSSGEPDRAGLLMEHALENAFERGLVSDAVIAQSEAQAAEFWRLRESIPEGEKAHGKAAKHDVSVPVSRMAAFMAEAAGLAETELEDAMVIAFGHVGDGNVHFNIARRTPGAGDDFLAQAAPVTARLYDLVDRHNGSISAEHGIGTIKQSEFLQRKPLEVELMRAIKGVIDPHAIMNPRVLLG